MVYLAVGFGGTDEMSLGGDHAHHRRVGKKDQETGAQQKLRDEHGLGAFTGLSFDVGQLAAAHAGRAGGQGLTYLRPVVGHQREGGGQVAQLVHVDVVAEPAQRLPGRDAGDPGVGEGVADAAYGQPSPTLAAVIRASGTPRPPARFIATRSRKALTACRKSRRRDAASCRSCMSGSRKKISAKKMPSHTGTATTTCRPRT